MIDLIAQIGRQAATRPDRPAFAWNGGSVDYAGLLRRVAGAATALAGLPPVIGLLAEDGLDWAVADLAAGAAGKTLVPVPAFFSREQMTHLLADAGVAHLLCDAALEGSARSLGLPGGRIPQAEAGDFTPLAGGARIIYTSGSTGRPKGVRLAGRQIAHSVAALAEASAASSDDRHLSLLPLPLLLEQICGIYLVLGAGAACHIARGVAARAAGGELAALVQACEAAQPTTTVLVPQLLAALAGGYAALGRRAPASLRFVAVGGAPVPASLLEAAWAVGIPACVGYGLSECCSVVTVSRPGSRSHSAGPPLPGVGVEIDDGEIVVTGPTVMQGYLGGEDPRGRWRSGDLGRFDAEGNLIVLGRKDNRLVTASGRNVSPEWIEAMVERDPHIGRCVVLCDRDGTLIAVVTPAGDTALSEGAAAAIVREATAGAPDYARPTSCITTTNDFIAREGLLNGKGEARRAGFARLFSGAEVPPQAIRTPEESPTP